MSALATPTETRDPGGLAEGLLDAHEPPGPRRFDALASAIVRLILVGDSDELTRLAKQLRQVVARWHERTGDDWSNARGQLRVLYVTAATAADRAPSSEVVSSIGANTHAHRVLDGLARAQSIRAALLAEHLGLRDDELSRTAARLLGELLVVRVKIGRDVYWEITPRGRDVLQRLGDADAVERPSPTADPRPARSAATAGNVVDIFTREPLELDVEELRREKEQTTSPQQRSRLLLLELAAMRGDTLTEQLTVWDRVANLGINNIRYVFPPVSAPETSLRRATWDLVDRFHDHPLPRAEWSKIAPPLWDGFALVEGENERRLLVLLEAKSELREFSAGRQPPRTDATMDIARHLLAGTSQCLQATRRWNVWPESADAARRLAFLLFLQQHGVDACVFNVYFVSPTVRDPHSWFRHVPQSRGEWDRYIGQVRAQLGIGTDHLLSPSITSACFVAH